MRDAFYRWDGFKFYASFSEFLPSVALVTVLWTIGALFTGVLVWLLFRVFEWFFLRIGLKIKIEHLLLFIGIFVLFAAMVWVGKRLIWYNTPLPLLLKLAVLICLILAAIFSTWRFHNNPDIVHEKITPLVWIFGIWFIVSVPLVAYYTWIKGTNNAVSQKTTSVTITDRNRPNIILVTFDALTSRDMSVYGYHRPTTPFIDKWAKSASLFTGAEAESNITTPTTASLEVS